MDGWMERNWQEVASSYFSPFYRCEHWGRETCYEVPKSQSSGSVSWDLYLCLSSQASGWLFICVFFVFFSHPTILASLVMNMIEQLTHSRHNLSFGHGFYCGGSLLILSLLHGPEHPIPCLQLLVRAGISKDSTWGPLWHFLFHSVTPYRDGFPNVIYIESLFLRIFWCAEGCSPGL